MFRVLILFATLAAGLAAPARAEDIEVDVELALMVDVSRSMAPAELEIQRRGYAEALRSDAVIGAISNGLIGAIAVTYVEWAGEVSQRVVVPWTRISTAEEARAVAAQITAHTMPGMRRTSIAGALLHAAEALKDNGFRGLRQVIDVSGDGPNNAGRPVLRARDPVLARGITINGLPLMTRDRRGAQWRLDNLDIYYRVCVIGGPGAFVIPVRDWSEFAAAVRRKLVLEIAGISPPPASLRPIPAQAADDPTDCLIGEKIWQRNRRFWEGP